MKQLQQKGNNAVAIWLLIGVGMIVVQVLLGGITRLTGSGLSITEWKPILGIIPPTTEAAWQEAFQKYQQIGQYKYINQHFTIGDFKFIYFWEWFHRVWARLIGIVFIVGFIYLLVKSYLRRAMIIPMIALFILGGLQGGIGWIMVKSGLNEEDIYVSHIRLAIHFIAALGLLAYTLWFAFQWLVPVQRITVHKNIRSLSVWITALLVLQLVYGAFMAGLKAATTATTWPDINGRFLPGGFNQFGGRTYSGWHQLTDHPIAVQFIHRTIAYLITALILYWFAKVRKLGNNGTLLANTRWMPPALVVLQVILGIFTVMNAANNSALLWLGVSHQFVAMLLLMCMVWILYINRAKLPS